MKQTHLGWFLPILIVLFPVLGGLGWESLQRYRFRTQSERLDAAIRTFRVGAVYIGEAGRPLPLASGRSSPPYFKLDPESVDGWNFHNRTWTLKAVFVDSRGLWHPLRLNIQIEQQRHLILGSPQVFVFWMDSPPESFHADFSEALRGFSYAEGSRQP